MGFFSFFSGTQPPLVKQAFGDVRAMLKSGHEMFAAAAAQLLDNEILDIDLKKLDEGINQREQNLRRAVLEHLNVDPERELIFSLKLISIVHEAERIGDLAKSLSKTADLAQRPRLGPLVEPLRDIRDRILAMFDQALNSFVESDESAARRLMRSHEEIKANSTTYLQMLSEQETITPNEAVVYALGARLLSRVSSHLANIASAVAVPFDHIRRSPTWPDEEKR